jgi:kynurenine formamidase
MTHFVELSHVIEPGMTVYPGLPPPTVDAWLTHATSKGHYAPGTTFHLSRVEFVTNLGTYVDAPFHRDPEGADLAGLPLSRLADLPGVVIDVTQRDQRAIGRAAFGEHDLAGRAVLIWTGWDVHWNTPAYVEPGPFVTREAAQWLANCKVAFVGIDCMNIDNVEDLTRPAHTILLRAGIPICEHMRNLAALPGTGFRLHAVPVAWHGVASFPVRAYAVVEGGDK